MKQSWSDEFCAFVVFVEIILLSSALGYFFRDWYVFAAILIGLLITSVIPILDIILALILSLSWGIIGAIIGQSFYNLEFLLNICHNNHRHTQVYLIYYQMPLVEPIISLDKLFFLRLVQEYHIY